MKITLCGSTRFMNRFNELNRELSKAGHIVYSVAAFGHSGDELTADEKIMLDLVHLGKIAESDAIIVIGAQPDGSFYIGESTSREIKWAFLNEKEIFSEKAWHAGTMKISEVSEALVNFRGSANDVIDHIRSCVKPTTGGGAA